MVNDRGQLFTIEGVAAGMIMLFTTYLVLSATTIYTPGDSHISDMQLEQIGSDALNMMNTPSNCTSSSCVSQLQQIVNESDYSPTGIPLQDLQSAIDFNTTFLNYINNRTGSMSDNLHYEAFVVFRNDTDTNTNSTWSYPLAYNRNLTGVEHPVRVTEWVIIGPPNFPGIVIPPTEPHMYLPKPRAVLVEVLLWRD
ncbi:MAG: hypothetical protein WCC86_03720 [Methanoregula sp.]|uniref:DUF7288 family protein n=1 Tax=Methanoregula sp. TaxID=2052170 RepID=UPI003BB08870